jgi:hypothetical protein
MPQKRETVTARVRRLEVLHADLDEKVKILFDAQIATEERFQRTDGRIEKLVIAIGELVSRMPAR